MPKLSLAPAEDSLLRSFSEVSQAIEAAKADVFFRKQFEKTVGLIIECFANGGRVYLAGNGGSAADCQHLAAEFVSRLEHERRPLPAEALTTDTSILTAVGNDYGFSEIFARQIDAKLQKNDLLIAMSTSGMSVNIIRALKVCKEKGISRIVWTGGSGGEAAKHCECLLKVPSSKTTVIQEIHKIVGHAVCRAVECTVIAGA